MTREDRVAWLSHPATQELIQTISIERENIKESWTTGNYYTEQAEKEALGMCKALAGAIEMVEATGGKTDDE